MEGVLNKVVLGHVGHVGQAGTNTGGHKGDGWNGEGLALGPGFEK